MRQFILAEITSIPEFDDHVYRKLFIVGCTYSEHSLLEWVNSLSADRIESVEEVPQFLAPKGWILLEIHCMEA